MKTLHEAIQKAERYAKAGNYRQTFYVVLSIGERDIAGNDYHVADELELETHYYGNKILHAS